MRFLGVDPGMSGGVAEVSVKLRTVAGGVEPIKNVIGLYEIPTMPNPNGKGRIYNHEEIRRLLQDVKDRAEEEQESLEAAVETSNPQPKDGSISGFKMGMGQELWKMAFAALLIPWRMVNVQMWHSRIIGRTALRLAKRNAGHKGTKTAAIAAAHGLFPGVDLRRTPKCKGAHDGFADALCVVEWLIRESGIYTQARVADIRNPDGSVMLPRGPELAAIRKPRPPQEKRDQGDLFE